MLIHLLMKKQSNLQVSPQVINSLLLSERLLRSQRTSNFFIKQLSNFFETLIKQGFVLVYIDDILLLSHSKEHMFQLIEQLHVISTKNNLKLAPEKSFFMLLEVKFLGHEIGYNTIETCSLKVCSNSQDSFSN